MIEFRDVTFSYPSSKGRRQPVFDRFNLRIASGRYVALMGPNGSGKSTLGKIAKGLLTPSCGQVWVAGRLLPPGEISSDVGYVFSNPENQIVSSVVEEDVAFGLENMGMEPAEIGRRVGESLRLVEMEAYRQHSPHLLSGGQQQKIVLAGTLALDSEILVLDEPTSMLDLKDRGEILDLFQKIHDRGKRTLLHITHSFDEALRAQDFIYLERGQIAYSGSAEGFLSSDAAIDPAIMLPSIWRVIQGLRDRGHDIPPEVRSLQELKEFLLRPPGA
jgi:energy-coupling factor transport system ATP-binding protein